jgi:addiction module RelE/StbE family toxin
MIELEFYPEFYLQLDKIKDYLSTTLKSQRAVQSLENELARKIKLLSFTPELGTGLEHIIKDLAPRFEGYYRLPVKNYLIIYQYSPREARITVTFIFHSSQDYQKLFCNN